MDKFINISCQNENVTELFSYCASELKKIPQSYNFGFIYVTTAIANDYPALVKQCKQASKIDHWVGTIGAGIIATGQEFYDKPAVSILLAYFAPEDFTMLPLIQSTDKLEVIKKENQFLTYFSIIHGDPTFRNTQSLIEGIYQNLEDSFLVGGLTSSNTNQYQLADEIHESGVSGVIFSENIPVLTNLSQGCNPVSDKLVITKSEQNIIYQLNSQRSLDTLMQCFNFKNTQELEKRANEVYIGLCIPERDIDDYVVRNLVAIDIEQNLFAINDMPVQGSELVFCERNKKSAITDMQRMLNNLSSRLKKPPKGGLYISCLGRGRYQFGQNSEEIKMIHEILGDFPLTGFFANGEIHHDKLYGYTGVLTLFL